VAAGARAWLAGNPGMDGLRLYPDGARSAPPHQQRAETGCGPRGLKA
jgi:hypothetical protein